MRAITLVLPYYDNPAMLREQARVWTAYHPKLKACLHVIVVDDGSPRWPAVAPEGLEDLGSFRLFRTLVDVRWNWLFCRNLGVEQATTEWVLLTDIDHAVPEDTLRTLICGEFDPACVYRFARIDAPDMQPKMKNGAPHPHPNTWFLTRAMFDRIGGYDERFSGHYGTDGEFRDRVIASAKSVVLTNLPMVRYPREVIADASTTTYGRKEEIDQNVARIRHERSLIKDWRPLRLTFPWVQVC